MPDPQPPNEQQIRVIVREEPQAIEQRIIERTIGSMRDMQTEILRGLERFARGNFARMHALETNSQDLHVCLAAIEERVLALETKRPGA